MVEAVLEQLIVAINMALGTGDIPVLLQALYSLGSYFQTGFSGSMEELSQQVLSHRSLFERLIAPSHEMQQYLLLLLKVGNGLHYDEEVIAALALGIGSLKYAKTFPPDEDKNFEHTLHSCLEIQKIFLPFIRAKSKERLLHTIKENALQLQREVAADKQKHTLGVSKKIDALLALHEKYEHDPDAITYDKLKSEYHKTQRAPIYDTHEQNILMAKMRKVILNLQEIAKNAALPKQEALHDLILELKNTNRTYATKQAPLQEVKLAYFNALHNASPRLNLHQDPLLKRVIGKAFKAISCILSLGHLYAWEHLHMTNTYRSVHTHFSETLGKHPHLIPGA